MKRLGDHILLYLPKNIGEHSKSKRNSVQNLRFQIGEALPLGALDYLHVGTSSRGSRLKPRTAPSHDWVEHGNS